MYIITRYSDYSTDALSQLLQFVIGLFTNTELINFLL